MRKMSLAMQILIGLVLGIIVGAIFYKSPSVETYLKPLGDIFIRLIKMIVAPILVSTLIVGVAGVGDTKKLGKLGGKTIIYFEAVTTFAIFLGLFVANVFKPGSGINLSALSKSDIHSYVATASKVGTPHSYIDFFVNIFPSNVFESFAKGDSLAIIFFSVMFGLGVAAIGERGKPIFRFFQGVSEIMFWMTNQIMKVAPIGVFGLIGVTVSKFGIASLLPLGKLIIAVYATMFFFVLIVLGIIAKLCGSSIFKMMSYLKDEIVLAFSTASSETVLPRLMEKMEKFGCPKVITSFVIPTGYSFNSDGASIYQSLTAVFIAQLYGINLSIGTQIMLVLVLMIASKGIAGVPGASFVILLATIGSVGLPVEGLAFVAGIDRILDMARTTVNVIGNALASVVVSKWEGTFDPNRKTPQLVLENKPLNKSI